MQGVRSVGIMDRILSSGTGRGRIAFFDLRANDYISVQQEALSRPPTPIPSHNNDDFPDSYTRTLYVDDYDYSDEDDMYSDESDMYSSDDDDLYSDEDDLYSDDELNQDIAAGRFIVAGEGNGESESAGAVQEIPARQHHPLGPPSFRPPMPVPAALTFLPAQAQMCDYELSTHSNLWLQSGSGWLDHNNVYM